MMDKSALLQTLNEQIFPALGCTEPAALAYAGSIAAKNIQGKIKSIKVTVDRNLYKNSLRVTIPKTDLKGLDYAVTLGVVGGNPAYRLEVLRDITEADIVHAKEMVAAGIVEIDIRKEVGLYIDVVIETGNDIVECRIEGSHDNVSFLAHNGKILYSADMTLAKARGNTNCLSFSTILEFIHGVPVKDIGFLAEGWKMNWEMAQIGLNSPHENFFGVALKDIYWKDNAKTDAVSYAKALTVAAVDARMNGVDRSVMTVAGSGNQGISSTIPVLAISKTENISREKTLRALALSQLITIYIKSKIGVLSPICGCVVAAGAGVSAAITYLLGGNDFEISAAVNNLIGGLAGTICDGAKGGCGFKIAIATSVAYDAAVLALRGVTIQPMDGIVDSDVEQTIENLAYITNKGMGCVDESLVKIMGYGKKKSVQN